MEIKINIPQNDYVLPIEVRQNVVQAICTSFLESHAWSIFHPFADGRGRRPTLYVDTKSPRGGFNSHEWADTHDGYVRFNGAEMKSAFDVLRKAGYHIFRVHSYGTWMGYVCNKKPFMEGGSEVREFNDFIE